MAAKTFGINHKDNCKDLICQAAQALDVNLASDY